MEQSPTWRVQQQQRFEKEGYWLPRTLAQELDAVCQRYASQLAVVDEHQRLTYQELQHLVSQQASGFYHLGLRKGDRVLVQLPNSADFIITCFALFGIGAIPIMMTMAHRSEELIVQCRVAEAVALIVADRFLGFDHLSMAHQVVQACPSVQHIMVSGHADANSVTLASLMREPQRMPGPHYCDTALLLLSGGTTGVAKLIPRTHTDYAFNARASSLRCAVDENTVYLAALPVAHNFPLACPGVLGTLLSGGCVVLAQTPGADSCFPLIERERVTMTALVPMLLAMWLDELPWNTHDLGSLRLIQSGGARLDPTLARRVPQAFHCTLQQVFGMAEGLLCYTSPDDPPEIVFHCQGRPLCDADELRVVDAQGWDVAPGEAGELLTRGPYTITGYYRAPEQNQRSFTVDGFYRSGDVVRISETGYLHVEGRLKEQVNRGGEKIAVAEIEETICTFPGVKDVALVALPDALLGERSCAFIIADVPYTCDTLYPICLSRGIARYKWPDEIIAIDHFPLTTIGKINKQALIALAQQRLSSKA